ncbi:conserved hypothetical protein [Gloeothece citriformis PCC 7424]|uniref:Uncharacterized protein n=1 Tax=Gloeothece citriformis (strain PCC 7424) TaxID=65393 RepID=B7KGY9_GLOC7|nr:hypothetical protein [Gloeothece citriformis]ACK73476.1 conserved hypothetical protein [Gloeothece citriformis PCC 7424]
MENWQKEFWLILETATQEAEQFFEEISQVIEEFAEHIQDEISTGIEELVEELFAPVFDSYVEADHFMADDFFNEEADLLINPKLEPNAQQYPACIGCRHYHGRLYGGNLLVCGMHPYGWEDDKCPDWQGV